MHYTFLLLLLFSTLLDAKQPSEKAIKAWLNQDNFKIIKLQSLYLLDNERAFLADVTFTAKDTLLKEGLILVRPELEEAEFIPSLPQDYIITDLDHDGVSELIFSQTFKYEPYTLIKRSIIQFHEYQRFVLYEAEYKQQTQCEICLVEDIQWKFKDLTGNKVKDLEQSYSLQLQSKNKTIIFKQEIKEIEFNKKGFRTPSRPANFVLSDMYIAKNVINREPLDIRHSFKLTDEKVYCFLDFKNVKAESKVIYYWIHEDLGKVLEIEQAIHPAKRFRTWLYKSLNAKEDYLGNWRVLITDTHQNLLASKEFSIIKGDIQDVKQ